MKRFLSALVLAVCLLSIPCAAVEPAVHSIRAFPGFADVAKDSWCHDAVALCYETGLMNGTSETTFSPDSPLTAAQLTVLSARLYSLRSGGSGTIPSLPDLSQPYLSFYGPDGALLRSYRCTDSLTHGMDDGLFISLSDTPDDPALPETCTLEIGFRDYGPIRRYSGVRTFYAPPPGVMTHGLTGTGYRFTDPDVAAFCFFLGMDSVPFEEEWWFSAAFYLASQGRLNLSGDLIWRVAPNHDPGTVSRRFVEPASRALFVWLLDCAASPLPPVQETVSIPDVDPESTPDADAILRLYRAGVVNGVDESGRFSGDAPLTRAQAAVMLSRVLDPALRIR